MSVEKFRDNLARVRERIHAAEIRSGRPSGCVRMVGVTKYVDAATTALLAAAGLRELGENRPQSLWEKAAAIQNPDIVWHLIGHLQRNKVKRTIEIASWIHSIDSDRLLNAVNQAALEASRTVNVLLEVNVSGDEAKHGYAPKQMTAALEQVAQSPQLRVHGLMCMAGLNSDPTQARREFSQLRELRNQLNSQLPANATMSELSMGMSGDFEIAIEEGATIVRIGSLLFE
jgi:pyridoxal phosphate enzyme (YggS family)